MADDYNYQSAGFDGFLSRSIDSVPQVTLDSAGPQTTQMRYDTSQLSGVIGDILRVGNIIFDGGNSTITLTSPVDGAKIVIDGINRTIEIFDTQNSRVLIGQLPTTDFGWAASIPGKNVENGFVN